MRLVTALRRVSSGSPADPVIGSAFGGGFYYAKISIDGLLYWLIDAGKSAETSLAMTVSGPSALSMYDGAANCLTLSGSAAVDYCTSYIDVDGNNDYYLGSFYETEARYHNLKPTNSANVIAAYTENPYVVPPTPVYTSSIPAVTNLSTWVSGGAQALSSSGTAALYTTSTYNSTNTTQVYNQSAIDGTQGILARTTVRPIRPIRKMLIPGQ